MVDSLNTKWKEFLFSFSGFGPNFLMVLMGAYFTDALNPAAMGANQTYQVIASGVCFITPALFPILFALSKIFDGIIDIPFAHITDTLSTKWGRRRPAIAVCMIPMIVGYAMCWLPIGGAEKTLLNTIWIFIWSSIFFASYTMCLIAYYGSFSTTCRDEAQRLRVSGYKSFFDTISYCLVYALVPVILEGVKLHIDKFVFVCLPLMLTIVIPLFLIKEGEKYGYPEDRGLSPQKISIWESLKLTFSNKTFLSWTAVNCCTFFGLQMFLVAMNAMMIGGMGFNGLEMALANTCAFGPVPVMLYFFNKLKARKGVRFTYQTCLLAFAAAIMSFFFASTFVTGGNKPVQYVIACLGGVLGSWAIGAFFMMPYLAPAQISSVEERLTGKNHSAMYFAANAVTTSIVGAISANLVYENIKNLFVSKNCGFFYATSSADAAAHFGVDVAQVFNFGTMIVPFIVCAVCIIGFFLAFLMPRDYSAALIAKDFKRYNPELDISSIESEEEKEEQGEQGEILFVQIGLSILSGFIFSFIWVGMLLRAAKKCIGGRLQVLKWVAACLIPFASIPIALHIHHKLRTVAAERGVVLKKLGWLIVVSGILFPLLPMNLIALAILQSNFNSIYASEAAAESEQADECLPVTV